MQHILMLQMNAEPSLSDVAKFAEGDDEASDGEGLWAHDTDEIIAAKKERSKNGNGSNNNHITLDRLKEEGEKAGYGKLYAACDGGVSGLQACAAGNPLLCQSKNRDLIFLSSGITEGIVICPFADIINLSHLLNHLWSLMPNQPRRWFKKLAFIYSGLTV